VITLFDIATEADLRPSPFCWRAKLALHHKGLQFESRGTVYSQIPSIGDGSFKTLPVLDDHGTWVGGSLAIAEYLESKTPAASLFPNDPQRLFSQFVEEWVETTLQAQIFPLVALRAYECFSPTEREYYRSTRERRLGTTLERARDLSVPNIATITNSFEPLRRILKTRPFLAGANPAYVDYLVFGALKWPRVISEDPLLKEDDVVADWYERIDVVARTL
jgi:glutathione S-transferase